MTVTCSLLQSDTGADCQKWLFLSLPPLDIDKFKSDGCGGDHEISCLIGDNPAGEIEPDDKLDGDGGAGLCCCHGTEPGGDNVCGTTFFTKIRYICYEKFETNI